VDKKKTNELEEAPPGLLNSDRMQDTPNFDLLKALSSIATTEPNGLPKNDRMQDTSDFDLAKGQPLIATTHSNGLQEAEETNQVSNPTAFGQSA